MSKRDTETDHYEIFKSEMERYNGQIHNLQTQIESRRREQEELGGDSSGIDAQIAELRAMIQQLEVLRGDLNQTVEQIQENIRQQKEEEEERIFIATNELVGRVEKLRKQKPLVQIILFWLMLLF
jgi:chromosome segregation ATPase